MLLLLKQGVLTAPVLKTVWNVSGINRRTHGRVTCPKIQQILKIGSFTQTSIAVCALLMVP